MPAAPPATETQVDWILTNDPFNPSDVDGSNGSAGIDVVAVATLGVLTPNWFVSIWYDHSTTL